MKDPCAPPESTFIFHNENNALRQRSGEVSSSSLLVSFLYTLMRDHVTPGIVEALVRDANIDSDVEFCNGYLAHYAKDVANRLK